MNMESHSAISNILKAGAGAAIERKDDLLLAIVAAAGNLQQMVLILQAQVENAPIPTVTNNEININGTSLQIPVTNAANGARIYHGLNTEDILVSAKDADGYQDPYTSAKADGPDHMIIRQPGNEMFTGTLIVDKVQTIQL